MNNTNKLLLVKAKNVLQKADDIDIKQHGCLDDFEFLVTMYNELADLANNSTAFPHVSEFDRRKEIHVGLYGIRYVNSDGVRKYNLIRSKCKEYIDLNDGELNFGRKPLVRNNMAEITGLKVLLKRFESFCKNKDSKPEALAALLEEYSTFSRQVGNSLYLPDIATYNSDTDSYSYGVGLAEGGFEKLVTARVEVAAYVNMLENAISFEIAGLREILKIAKEFEEDNKMSSGVLKALLFEYNKVSRLLNDPQKLPCIDSFNENEDTDGYGFVCSGGSSKCAKIILNFSVYLETNDAEYSSEVNVPQNGANAASAIVVNNVNNNTNNNMNNNTNNNTCKNDGNDTSKTGKGSILRYIIELFVLFIGCSVFYQCGFDNGKQQTQNDYIVNNRAEKDLIDSLKIEVSNKQDSMTRMNAEIEKLRIENKKDQNRKGSNSRN